MSTQFTQSKNGPPKVNYTDLMDTMIKFQLQEHEKFLAKFVQLFGKIDQDNNGILSNDEFVELYGKMGLGHKPEEFMTQANKFLDILDPYQCDRVTFSDIVQLFTNHKLEQQKAASKEANKDIRLLSKISEKLDGPEDSYNTDNFNSKNFPVPGESEILYDIVNQDKDISRELNGDSFCEDLM